MSILDPLILQQQFPKNANFCKQINQQIAENYDKPKKIRKIS